jgi:hypothetical protein
MALVDEEERRRAERAHQVALFRYLLMKLSSSRCDRESRLEALSVTNEGP